MGHATAVSVLSASETTLLTITDIKMVQKSQLTVYFDVTLGSATQVNVKYYFSPNAQEASPTWFQVPIKDTSSGILSNIPSVIDSTSPSQSTNIRTVEDLQMSGSYGLKITGQAVTANATLNSIYVVGRDN